MKLLVYLFSALILIELLTIVNTTKIELNDSWGFDMDVSTTKEISKTGEKAKTDKQDNNKKRKEGDAFLQYNNDRVIANANGADNPMIPVAAGIGGEVIVACTECQKIISRFVQRCVDQEAAGLQADTLRAFCEFYRDKPHSRINPETCLILNAKLASVTGEPGNEIIDPTKPPFECIKFKSQCDNFGGPPHCYSGFCESVAECIDCPIAIVDIHNDGNYIPETCGGAGVCRLGWKNPQAKGGNGYCECKSGMKGLACNKY